MVSAIGSSTQSYILQALQSKYAATDADSNGSLTLSEFEAGASDAVSGLEDLFTSLDSDGDGALSEDEFTTGIQEQSRPPPPTSNLSGDVSQKLAELFQSVDSDEDGYLSLEEFDAGTPADAPDDQEALFNEIDTNGDGLLSEEEFTTALASNGPGGSGGPPPGGPPPGGGGGISALDEEDEDLISEILANYLDATDGVDEETQAAVLKEAEESLLDVFDQDEDGEVTNEEAFAGLQALRKASFDYLISLQGEEQVAA